MLRHYIIGLGFWLKAISESSTHGSCIGLNDFGLLKSREILENLFVPEWTKEFSGIVFCEDKGGG
jgi:hypothetical protein